MNPVKEKTERPTAVQSQDFQGRVRHSIQCLVVSFVVNFVELP